MVSRPALSELNMAEPRPGVVRQLVFTLEKVAHWDDGREISTDSIRMMALWLRSKERKLWRNPGMTQYPSVDEAWAAARVYAHRVEWRHEGAGANETIDELITHEIEEIEDERAARHLFKSRSDFYPGSMVHGRNLET